jgi:hypothetical protein
MVRFISLIARGCVCQWPLETLAPTDMPLKRIFTDTDMHDPLLRDEIEDFYLYLQKILCLDQLEIPSNNYDLVLDIMPVEDKIQWAYYYACHEKRCLFWLETYDATYMLSEVYGVKSPAHISALHLSSRSSAISTNLTGRASTRGLFLVRRLPSAGFLP